MTLPPWLRTIQQSWWFHILFIPFATVFFAALENCAGNDFANFSVACLLSSVKAVGAYAVVYVVGVLQHSPGSASYNPDGTLNQQVLMVKK